MFYIILERRSITQTMRCYLAKDSENKGLRHEHNGHLWLIRLDPLNQIDHSFAVLQSIKLIKIDLSYYNIFIYSKANISTNNYICN